MIVEIWNTLLVFVVYFQRNFKQSRQHMLKLIWHIFWIKNYSSKFSLYTVKMVWSNSRHPSYISWLFLYKILFYLSEKKSGKKAVATIINILVNKIKKGKQKTKTPQPIDQTMVGSTRKWTYLAHPLKFFMFTKQQSLQKNYIISKQKLWPTL